MKEHKKYGRPKNHNNCKCIKKVSLQRQRLSDQIVKGIKKTMNIQLSVSSQGYIHEQLGKVRSKKVEKEKRKQKIVAKRNCSSYISLSDKRFQILEHSISSIRNNSI